MKQTGTSSKLYYIVNKLNFNLNDFANIDRIKH